MKIEKSKRRERKRFKDRYAPKVNGLPLGVPKYTRLWNELQKQEQKKRKKGDKQ